MLKELFPALDWQQSMNTFQQNPTYTIDGMMYMAHFMLN